MQSSIQPNSKFVLSPQAARRIVISLVFPTMLMPFVNALSRVALPVIRDHFQIEPDVDLQLMRSEQSLAGLTARCLEALHALIRERRPDCLVAQGDTTSVLAASLAAFYERIPFVHVEAGLRSGNLSAPWPEEMNRRVAGVVATLHCAPTCVDDEHPPKYTPMSSAQLNAIKDRTNFPHRRATPPGDPAGRRERGE